MKKLNIALEVLIPRLKAANMSVFGYRNRHHHNHQGVTRTLQMSVEPCVNNYAKDHRIAKMIVCQIYILIGAISIETGNSYIALVAGTTVWFFGTNVVGYLIETLRGHNHSHNVF